MSTAWRLALIVGALLALAVLLALPHAPSTLWPVDSQPSFSSAPRGSINPGPMVETAREERTPIEASGREGAPAPSTTAVDSGHSRPVVRVRGVVRDRFGASVARARVDGTDPASVLGHADEKGRFEVEVGLPNCLEASGDALVPLLRACVRGPTLDEQLLVVGGAVDVAGRVIGAQGEPLGGARLWLRLEPAAFEHLEVPSDASCVVERFTTSRADGRFELIALPIGPGSTIRVHHASGGEAAIDVPDHDTDELVIRLAPHTEASRSVVGEVVHRDGSPAGGAGVQLGEHNSIRCDADGKFALTVRAPFEDESLIAYHVGYQPAVVPDYGRSLSTRAATTIERLVLGPPSLRIQGHVEDVAGVGLQGWTISIVTGGLEVSANRLPPMLAAMPFT